MLKLRERIYGAWCSEDDWGVNDSWIAEDELMGEELDEFIASLTPAEAWEQCWVGEQSAAEFILIGIDQGLRNIQHMVCQYIRAISEDDYSGLRDASPEQLDKVANLLLAYIDKELQYDPHGQAYDLLQQCDMDTIANCMDDDIKEMLRNHLHPYTYLPYTDLDVVRAYLNLHRPRFNREFEIGQP